MIQVQHGTHSYKTYLIEYMDAYREGVLERYAFVVEQGEQKTVFVRIWARIDAPDAASVEVTAYDDRHQVFRLVPPPFLEMMTDEDGYNHLLVGLREQMPTEEWYGENMGDDLAEALRAILDGKER